MLLLDQLSNDELLNQTKLLKGEEDQTIADIVRNLSEIDSRGIYRDAGYSCLFRYCRECLHYSEGAAGRRVQAAKRLKEAPEIYELLRTGKLSLSALSEVAPVMTKENSEMVLSLAEGKSKREAADIAVQFGAPKKPKRDSIRPKRVEVKLPVDDLFAARSQPEESEVTAQPRSEKRYTMSFEITNEGLALYEQAKALIGHCTIAEVFERALREYLRKHHPGRARKPVVRKEPREISYGPVSKSLRREVFVRDGGRCTFVSDSGARCSETRCLHVDHVIPDARGGSNLIENLRLLCAAHNQLAAERCFGRGFMEAKRQERGSHATS